MTSRPHAWRCTVITAAVAMSLLAGCATRRSPDPLQPLNRKVFAFNETVDEYVIEPPAEVYRDYVPEPIRIGVTNFFNNIRDAWSAVNLLLQGRIGESGQDVIRFGVNTVMGFGGVMDWGSRMGLEPHYEDFGQTLGVWGVPPGAYLVLPILGSSTARDVVGLPVDLLASPDGLTTSARAANAMRGVRVINTRANLIGAANLLDDIALDKYTFVRDAYLQRRRSLVSGGASSSAPEERYDLPDPKAAAGAAAAPTAPASAASAPATGDKP